MTIKVKNTLNFHMEFERYENRKNLAHQN